MVLLDFIFVFHHAVGITNQHIIKLSDGISQDFIKFSVHERGDGPEKTFC